MKTPICLSDVTKKRYHSLADLFVIAVFVAKRKFTQPLGELPERQLIYVLSEEL